MHKQRTKHRITPSHYSSLMQVLGERKLTGTLLLNPTLPMHNQILLGMHFKKPSCPN